MSTFSPSTVLVSTNDSPFERAHMAAASFLARYSGRTLETYRYDLRSYFEWCGGVGLEVLEAQRPHTELWRAASEERWTRRLNHRPAVVHDLRVLSLRPYRRAHWRQPGTVRP